MPTEGIRRGSRTSFWGTVDAAGVAQPVSVSANGTSNAVQVGRKTSMFTFFINSSGASTFQLQVAHVGDPGSQGTLADPTGQTFIWYDLWYLGNSGTGNSTPVTIAFSGAATIASIIPDFEPDWVRLKCTVAGSPVNVYAGHEAWGD